MAPRPTKNPGMPEVSRAFGERVKARRTELGFSLEALAATSDMHWSYVGHVERGAVNPTLHSIVKLAAMLEMDPAELVRGLKPPAEDGSAVSGK